MMTATYDDDDARGSYGLIAKIDELRAETSFW